MQYVARYDNGSGYMEWACQPTSRDLAIQVAQGQDLLWTDTDIIQVNESRIEIGRPEQIRISRVVPDEVFEALDELGF